MKIYFNDSGIDFVDLISIISFIISIQSLDQNEEQTERIEELIKSIDVDKAAREASKEAEKNLTEKVYKRLDRQDSDVAEIKHMLNKMLNIMAYNS